MIISTGSPLAPESFDYVYEKIKSDVCLSSVSGGTDIMAAFADASPVLPVYRGELQSRSLGMAVDVFDEEGNSIVGEKGELVCTKPFPSMPLGFWNDRGDERYHAAYFAKYPNVWCHGDWCELTERGTMLVYGRSDATLNPGGVRIGTAEIYRVVEQIDEVEEAVAIGQLWPPDNPTDTRVVLFVKLRANQALDAESGRPHPLRDPPPRFAAPRAGAHRAGRGHPAHQERESGRAGGEGRGARHAGGEHRRARQSGSARAFQGSARARRLIPRFSSAHVRRDLFMMRCVMRPLP